MDVSARSIRPIQSIFGNALVLEHHLDGDQRNLPVIERERRFAAFVSSLHGLVFGDTTKR